MIKTIDENTYLRESFHCNYIFLHHLHIPIKLPLKKFKIPFVETHYFSLLSQSRKKSEITHRYHEIKASIFLHN